MCSHFGSIKEIYPFPFEEGITSSAHSSPVPPAQQIPAWLVALPQPLWRSTHLGCLTAWMSHQPGNTVLPSNAFTCAHCSKPALTFVAPEKSQESILCPEALWPARLQTAMFSFHQAVLHRPGQVSSHFNQAGTLFRV